MTKRVSPLDPEMKPEKTLNQNRWEIPLTYLGERFRSPVVLSDLSHVPKWTLQGHDLDSQQVAGLSVPAGPGAVALEQGLLVVRLTQTECRIMCLDGAAHVFTDPGYTDMTDAFATFCVIGEPCFEIVSKLSAVDLHAPHTPSLFAAQAPVEDIACLLVRIQTENGPPGLIVSCPRGYGHFFLKAFLDAGKSFEIAIAGWQRFSNWLSMTTEEISFNR